MRLTFLAGVLSVLVSVVAVAIGLQHDVPLIVWRNPGKEELDLRMTDIPHLRAGQVGAAFWTVVVPPSIQGSEALRTAIEQFDVIDRMITRYPDTFEFATSADDIEHIFKAGKIASLVSIDGSQSIQHSLGVLRILYKLGARSMTPANCQPAAGLDPFGESVVKEMNWLGMLVDLSTASDQATLDALRVTKAPVIFSRGGGCSEIPEETLKRVRDNGGLVMVPLTATAMDEIDRVRRIAGIDHIGIGSADADVSTFPDLTAALLRRNYSNDDIQKVLGLNMLRVMHEVERVSDKLHGRE